MSSALRLEIGPTPTSTPSAALRLGLQELLKAHDSARLMDLPPWELAVTLAGLFHAGLSETDLRLLGLRGYLLHRLEKAPLTDGRRQFEELSPLALTEHSCFLLSDRGLAFARHFQQVEDGVPPARHAPGGDGQDPVLLPRWDCRRRELRLGEQVILHFLRPAPNREAILMEFEANGWVRRISNPLKSGSGRMAKLRLQATIKDLNRSRRCCLIAFGGDGTGQGVLWQMIG
jgi:hypothetical protein